MAKLAQNGVTDTLSDPESRILVLTKNNPNRHWMQLIVFSNFSLTVGGNDRGFSVLVLDCDLRQELCNRPRKCLNYKTPYKPFRLARGALAG